MTSTTMPRPCSHRRQRRALLALYAFNVEIARVREQVSQPLPGEIRLQWWIDMLAALAMAASRVIQSRPNFCRRSGIRSAGRAVVATDRGAPVRSLQRSDADMAALEGYLGDTSWALFALAARVVGAPIRGDGSSGATRRSRARLARVIATLPLRRLAAAALRAAAVAGAARRERGRCSRAGRRLSCARPLAELPTKRGASGGALALLATLPPRARPVFFRWRLCAATDDGARGLQSVRAADWSDVPQWRAAVARICAASTRLSRSRLARPPARKLKRSRRFLPARRRCAAQLHVSVRSVINGSIRSIWFIAMSCRISVRTLAGGVAWQACDDLDVLRRLAAACAAEKSLAAALPARASASTKA